MIKPKKNKKSNYSSATIQKPRRSISRRWSVANAAFFFVTIVIFAAVIYQIVFASISDQNKAMIYRAMDQISSQLQKSDEAITIHNIREHFDYRSSLVENNAGQLVQTSSVISQMISSRNMDFYIFDNRENMIFTTSSFTDFPFEPSTGGEIRTVEIDGRTGYLYSRAVKSEHTGQTVAYLTTFYDIAGYNNLRSILFNSFLIVGIVTLLAALVFGYWMADSFLYPLKKIEHSMAKVISHPEDENFEPVVLKQDDEIKLIADFYNQMMERINYFVEQQKGFVSDVSHELRTPIAVIEGHLQMLNRWGKDDPEVLEDSLKIAADEVSHMKNMLEEMLALSRLEHIPEKHFHETMFPVQAVENRLPNFEMLHPDFKIEFINKIKPNTKIKMDEAHYQQILNILLDNAAKYTVEDRKEITVELEEKNGYVETSVADSGIGISQEEVNLIFERFFRADQARSREIPGTGLGLSIMKNLVTQYKGEVSLSSKVGEGSRFTFKIPKAVKKV